MAVAAKTSEPASDRIMPASKMKPLLVLSKAQPVQAAIGLSADGEGLILLDRKAKPRKVLSMLRADAGRAKIALNTGSLRFGRAEVDPEYDAGMVRFFVNKDAPGNMRVKLLELVKRSSFQKVEINVDPALEAEPEEDEASEAGAPSSTAPPPDLDRTALARELAALIGRIAEAAGGDAGRRSELSNLAAEANGALKAGDAAAARQAMARLREALDRAATPPGTEALKKTLAALIGRIAGSAGEDAAHKALLVKHATDANGFLKGNAPEKAAQSIAALPAALDPAASPAGGAPTESGADPVGIWWDAKDRVNEQIEQLRRAFLETGHQLAAAACEKGLSAFSGGLLVRFQTALVDYNQAAGEMRAAKSQSVRKIGGALKAFVAQSATLSILEDNPFHVAVTIRGDIVGAVDTITAGLAP